MNLRYITCSGIREYTSYEKIIGLLNLSEKVEIGIPANSSIMGHKKPGNTWLFDLLDISADMEKPLNISIHMNNDWAQLFCSKGIIPFDIVDWFFENNKKTDEPVIKRWQFDFGNNPNKFDTEKITKAINNNPELEFIFSYHEGLKQKFYRLNDMGAKFSLIHNTFNSYNRQNQRWSPMFNNKSIGYIGGLCPENIEYNLNKISAMVPNDANIWIEGYKRLLNQSQEFDFHQAEKFVNNALEWQTKQKVR